MKALQPLLVLAAAGLIVGCNPFTGACTLELRPGIVVEVRDAVTGAPAADGARLVARDGNYVETVDGPPAPNLTFLQAAGERPGRYDLTVSKPGYHNWTRAGVRVRDGGCHVIPVQLEAQLQPAG
jgi:hypothetical protein